MAPIADTTDVRDIPLDQLEVGLGQVRTRNINKDIEELAESIHRVGLLEPIVVCEGDTPGKYQILTGQRRFKAVQSLGQPTIKALVINRKVSAHEAKIISLTENAVRLDLTRPELVDAVSYLYYHYDSSVSAVADATGLSTGRIRRIVKFDRLIPQLQELVRSKAVNIDIATTAQDAASVGKEQPDAEEAVKLARAMAPMRKDQRDRVQKDRTIKPDAPIEEIIEDATTAVEEVRLTVQISANTVDALDAYSDAEGSTRTDAAVGLIEAGLTSAGYLE